MSLEYDGRMTDRRLRIVQPARSLDDLDALVARLRERGGRPLTVGRDAAMRGVSYAEALRDEIARLEAGGVPLVFCRHPGCLQFHPAGACGDS